MRIAIIGAGFAGLSAAWHLQSLSLCKVVLFDAKGVGGGASGIAAGLMHPYVGLQGNRSLYANEGMQATRQLIAAAQEYAVSPIIVTEGILRYVDDEEQYVNFMAHVGSYGDVEPRTKESFWIRSGITVDCPVYLEGLWRSIENRGAELLKQKIEDLEVLSGFDHVVIAAGGGARALLEGALPIGVVKGQMLKCKGGFASPSVIGKGYMAQKTEFCYLGSTYERGFVSEEPDLDAAKRELFPKIASFYPAVNALEVMECQAALRVTRVGHYAPFATGLGERLWALTALGSRGLLYHAYAGKVLADAILNGGALPKEFQRRK